MFSSPEKNVLEFGFMPGQMVADFGSGAGHYSLALAALLGESGAVYSVDLRQDALVRIKSVSKEVGLRNIEVILGDIEKLGGSGLKDALVDGVVLSNILFQLKDKSTAAAEAYRITRPGGRLCLVEWSLASPIAHVAGKKSEDIVSAEKARKIFTEAGFTFERKFEAGEHHYGVIFRK